MNVEIGSIHVSITGASAADGHAFGHALAAKLRDQASPSRTRSADRILINTDVNAQTSQTDLVQTVVAAIADAARSGHESGDGIVWTTPVEHPRTSRASSAAA